MNPDEETSTTDVEAQDAPDQQPETDDHFQQLATLAVFAAVAIVFLAICLPLFIL
jgi:hypothetical protein